MASNSGIPYCNALDAALSGGLLLVLRADDFTYTYTRIAALKRDLEDTENAYFGCGVRLSDAISDLSEKYASEDPQAGAWHKLRGLMKAENAADGWMLRGGRIYVRSDGDGVLTEVRDGFDNSTAFRHGSFSEAYYFLNSIKADSLGRYVRHVAQSQKPEFLH
ncbi:MAG: hypothetical protein HY518_05500 [Candidatus Aenigmarchaeota archaeon]|nr:hypothetical protein [Candidatus Aenigmarchaeota archaeon]